jgi:murein DD-endopeptidase MepM/ murein hydrolase activator NlpD
MVLACAPVPVLLLSGCANPKPPAKSPASPPATRAAQSTPKAERWRAVPARADGSEVPGGRRHIVKRGETGIAIANAYRVPWSRIAAANGLDRDSVLQVGQGLFIPTNRPAPTSASASPSPARKPQPGTRAPAASAEFELDLDDLITGSAPVGEGPAPTQPIPRQATTAVPTAVPPLAWPIDGRVILSRYGPKPGGRVNDGVNIKTLRGAAVRAAAGGEVVYVGDAIAGFGLMMLVRHAGGTVTAYAHLEDVLAARGDRVERGQPIARAGSSGSATEPQLHFQLRQGRRTLDPLLYLPR